MNTMSATNDYTRLLGAPYTKASAPFVILSLDALSKNDVHLVIRERQSRDSKVERSVILYSSDGGTSWVRQLVSEGRTDYHNALVDVHFVSANLGWAAGYNGIILRTTDGGASWELQKSPTEATLTKIQFVDDTSGWILAERGGEILHTTDGGRKWVSYQFPAEGRVTSLSFCDKVNGWIVGEKGQVFRTTNSGQSWQVLGNDLLTNVRNWEASYVNFVGVRFFSKEVGLIAAGISQSFREYSPNGIIFKTTDAGRTWKSITVTASDGLKRVDFTSSQDVWVIIQDYRDERLLHTTDAGNTWTFVRGRSKAGVVRFVDGSNGWLIAGLSDYPIIDVLVRTKDGGKTWAEVTLPKWVDDK